MMVSGMRNLGLVTYTGEHFLQLWLLGLTPPHTLGLRQPDMLECVLKSQTLLLVELSDHSASPCFQKKVTLSMGEC